MTMRVRLCYPIDSSVLFAVSPIASDINIRGNGFVDHVIAD